MEENHLKQPEHTPYPSPERAIYGFVLYLFSIIGFGLYLIWAYIPDSLLNAVGFTYFPQKYWAITLPAYAIMIVLLGYVLYIAATFINTSELDSIHIIKDEYSHECTDATIPSDAIPPLYDIPISTVNQQLYIKNYQSI